MRPDPRTHPPPLLSPIDLPASSAVSPGVGIYVQYADGSGGMGCTAGFLVRTSTGQPGVLTAGHCNRPGEPSKVTMNLAGILPYTTLGTFSRTVSEGVQNEQHDIGLIVLNGDNVPQIRPSGPPCRSPASPPNCRPARNSANSGWVPAKPYADRSRKSPIARSCSWRPGQCGDSGGPVYLNDSDGTVRAVGILIRGGDPYTPKLKCSAPAKFSVAELIRPWLDKWRLTPVTAATASP